MKAGCDGTVEGRGWGGAAWMLVCSGGEGCGGGGASVGNGVSCRGSRESRHLNKTASG